MDKAESGTRGQEDKFKSPVYLITVGKDLKTGGHEMRMRDDCDVAPLEEGTQAHRHTNRTVGSEKPGEKGGRTCSNFATTTAGTVHLAP